MFGFDLQKTIQYLFLNNESLVKWGSHDDEKFCNDEILLSFNISSLSNTWFGSSGIYQTKNISKCIFLKLIRYLLRKVRVGIAPLFLKIGITCIILLWDASRYCNNPRGLTSSRAGMWLWDRFSRCTAMTSCNPWQFINWLWDTSRVCNATRLSKPPGKLKLFAWTKLFTWCKILINKNAFQ